MQRKGFFHRLSASQTASTLMSNDRKSLQSTDLNQRIQSCLYLQTRCWSCWSLTSEIIVYDPKQLSGLGHSWDQEFQKPLRDEGIFCLRFFSASFTVLQSSTALYLHTAGAGIGEHQYYRVVSWIRWMGFPLDSTWKKGIALKLTQYLPSAEFLNWLDRTQKLPSRCYESLCKKLL